MSNSYDGLLFDFDGVIADTEPLHWKSWVAALEPHGLHLKWEDYCRFCRGTAATEMRDRFRVLFPDIDRIADLDSRYQAAKLQNFARLPVDPPIPPETVRLLCGLRNVRVGLVTTAMRPIVEPALLAAGIRKVFHVFVFREDVVHPKPAPDAYLLAAERLSAGRVVVFEDTEPGAESARAAGLDVVMVPDCAALPALVRAYARS